MILMRSVALVLLIFAADLSSPTLSYALQAHGYKGLYVHQGAHIFFILAMLSFIFRIHNSKLKKRAEWKWISHGALLLSLWNVWAFTGHVIEIYIPAENIKLLAGKQVPSILISSWKEVAYFILKMDHLVSVPAVICFYFGIKKIQGNIEQKTS